MPTKEHGESACCRAETEDAGSPSCGRDALRRSDTWSLDLASGPMSMRRTPNLSYSSHQVPAQSRRTSSYAARASRGAVWGRAKLSRSSTWRTARRWSSGRAPGRRSNAIRSSGSVFATVAPRRSGWSAQEWSRNDRRSARQPFESNTAPHPRGHVVLGQPGRARVGLAEATLKGLPQSGTLQCSCARRGRQPAVRREYVIEYSAEGVESGVDFRCRGGGRGHAQLSPI